MKIKTFLLILLIATPFFSSDAAQLPEGTIQFTDGEGQWLDAPKTLPAGTKLMMLEGHPSKTGMFTIRLKVPAGTRLEPHWHPREERVTIFTGQARVGFGDVFDSKQMATFGPKAFYVNPAKSHHFVEFVEETVMQITGMGPWQLHYLKK